MHTILDRFGRTPLEKVISLSALLTERKRFPEEMDGPDQFRFAKSQYFLAERLVPRAQSQ